MSCHIKVNELLELHIDGELDSSWNKANVVNGPIIQGKTRRGRFVDIDVVRQMCDMAYAAGGSSYKNKIDKIRSIVKE